jgi:predicted  nucleic acid-binding Zn-ribbon protein
MSRSESLYILQQLDSIIDSAHKRITDIDRLMADDKAQVAAEKVFQQSQTAAKGKSDALKDSELLVADQSSKIAQNQKKLYSGVVTNPKELEDLQLEANSLSKYLRVLEDKQLEAMLDLEAAQAVLDQAAAALESLISQRSEDHQELLKEKSELMEKISKAERDKDKYLSEKPQPDLEVYKTLRKASGGIAVTLMVSSSCQSCGANIPSAIEQQARSPANLAFCPTCKRILHPG